MVASYYGGCLRSLPLAIIPLFLSLSHLHYLLCLHKRLSLALQWRAEQLSQRLFNISAHLLPLGLRQTILHIAAQP